MNNFVLVIAILLGIDALTKLIQITTDDKSPPTKGMRAFDVVSNVALMIWAIQLLTGAKA